MSARKPLAEPLLFPAKPFVPDGETMARAHLARWFASLPKKEQRRIEQQRRTEENETYRRLIARDWP